MTELRAILLLFDCVILFYLY